MENGTCEASQKKNRDGRRHGIHDLYSVVEKRHGKRHIRCVAENHHGKHHGKYHLRSVMEKKGHGETVTEKLSRKAAPVERHENRIPSSVTEMRHGKRQGMCGVMIAKSLV